MTKITQIDAVKFQEALDAMCVDKDKQIAELQAAQQQSAGEVLNLIPVNEAKEFWKSIYADGVTLQDIANELSDMHIMLENVPKVYCEVTGGELSKPNYLASSVIGEFKNYVESIADEVRAEYVGEIAELKTDNDRLQAQINELRKALEESHALNTNWASELGIIKRGLYEVKELHNED